MAYRVTVRPDDPGGRMWRAGRLFTSSPVVLSDEEAVPAILNERAFVVEDLGRDVVQADATDKTFVAAPSRKRRR